MANFEKAIAFVLKAEGGYVNDPKDSGGETKYGISKKNFPRIDIKNLTPEQAEEIYKKDFWEKYAINKFEDDALALVYFDAAVNMGPGRAKSLLEASGSDARDFLLKRIGYYTAITRKNSNLKKFLPGWINRVMDCYNEIS